MTKLFPPKSYPRPIDTIIAKDMTLQNDGTKTFFDLTTEASLPTL